MNLIESSTSVKNERKEVWMIQRKQLEKIRWTFFCVEFWFLQSNGVNDSTHKINQKRSEPIHARTQKLVSVFYGRKNSTVDEQTSKDNKRQSVHSSHLIPFSLRFTQKVQANRLCENWRSRSFSTRRKRYRKRWRSVRKETLQCSPISKTPPIVENQLAGCKDTSVFGSTELPQA